MITVQREDLRAVYAEGQELLRDHWRAIALHQEDRVLAPDWGRYEALEQENALVVITARDQHQRLVGYAGFILSYHLHYRYTLGAANDVVYLDPKHQARAGWKLIKFSDQLLPTLGVEHILWHVKFSRDFRPLLYRLGYVDEEVIVGRFIKKGT